MKISFKDLRPQQLHRQETKKLDDTTKQLFDYINRPEFSGVENIKDLLPVGVNPNMPCACLIIKIDRFEVFKGSCSPMDVDLYRYGIRNIFEELMLAQGIIPCYVNRFEDRMEYLLFNIPGLRNFEQNFNETAQTCMSRFYDYIGIETSFFISCGESCEKANLLYAEVNDIAKYGFYFGSSIVLDSSVINEESDTVLNTASITSVEVAANNYANLSVKACNVASDIANADTLPALVQNSNGLYSSTVTDTTKRYRYVAIYNSGDEAVKLSELVVSSSDNSPSITVNKGFASFAEAWSESRHSADGRTISAGDLYKYDNYVNVPVADGKTYTGMFMTYDEDGKMVNVATGTVTMNTTSERLNFATSSTGQAGRAARSAKFVLLDNLVNGMIYLTEDYTITALD